MNSANQEDNPQLSPFSDSLDHLRHLLGQFTSRSQHDALDSDPLGVDLRYQRRPETNCLAGTGLGLSNDVSPGENRLDNLLLDRGTVADAHLLETGDDIVGEIKAVEPLTLGLFLPGWRFFYGLRIFIHGRFSAWLCFLLCHQSRTLNKRERG